MNLKRVPPLLCFLLFSIVYAEETEEILSSAEALFIHMKEKDYKGIWMCLTEKSKERIVQDVYIASEREGVRYKKADIYKDFTVGGLLSRSYWTEFLKQFDPGIVLEHSRWELGKIEKDRAYLIIRYEKSENPALIKMFKEEGKWKVGLIESFVTGR